MPSFHRLNRSNPAINAAIIGERKVNNPKELVKGLIYGARKPNIIPEAVPNIGPNNGAVNPLSSTLENVIVAPVPNMGYAGINEAASNSADQIAIKAMRIV